MKVSPLMLLCFLVLLHTDPHAYPAPSNSDAHIGFGRAAGSASGTYFLIPMHIDLCSDIKNVLSFCRNAHNKVLFSHSHH